MSKVSVIIPYLKGQAYLEDCINSVMEQNLADYEILVISDKDGDDVPESVMKKENVVVYDAMTELSETVKKRNVEKAIEWKEYCLGFRLEKVMLDYAEKGQKTPSEKEVLQQLEKEWEETETYPYGVAVCRNLGIEKATGDYVYFLDCDDYLLEGALQRLVDLAEEKDALITTGNKYSSWFRPISFNFEKAQQETFIEGIQQMKGQVLQERFIEMFSAQHLLINRKFLLENQIVFDQEMMFLPDMRFCVQALKLAGDRMWVDGDSLYVWRHRNDKIHLPALCQIEKNYRAIEFAATHSESKKMLSKEDLLSYMLERYMVKFAMKKFPGRLKGDAAISFTKAMQKMPEWKKILKEYRFMQRVQLNYIRKGKYRLARYAVKYNHWRNKKKGLIGSRIQWYRVLERHIFKKMPIRYDWVLFESFFGKSYSDSPKYLYEYLQKTRGDKYRYIWTLNKKSEALSKTGKHKRCKMNSLRYVYYTARAGYRIFNVRQPAWCTKRPEVTFLETWHGTPLKKLVFDVDDLHSASQNHKTLFYKHSREWNYLISANPFSTDVFERAFAYDRDKILEYGYPRNDVLYAENRDEIAAEVKKELGIPEGKRVLLYAPTWRDDQFYDKGKYKFTLALDLARLQKEFGDDTVVLLRTHYYIADILDLSEYEGFVFNGSQYEDVSRLYLASDICMTDYSSVFFDYANLKRPLLFFVYDYDSYADEIRGLYIDMEKELPGPILHTNDEVVEALRDMDAVTEKYKERYEEFYERFCSVDDGHACERTIEKVFGERENAEK